MQMNEVAVTCIQKTREMANLFLNTMSHYYTVLKITGGHRPISNQIVHMTVQLVLSLVNCSKHWVHTCKSTELYHYDKDCDSI